MLSNATGTDEPPSVDGRIGTPSPGNLDDGVSNLPPRGVPGLKAPPTQEEEGDQGVARRPDELGDPRVRRMEGGAAARRGVA